MTDDITRTMTIPECARILGIGRQTAYSLAATGELPGVIRLGGAIRVSKAAINALLEDAAKPKAPAVEA